MIRPATAADAVAMAAVEAEARALLEAQGVHFDRLDLPEGFSEEMTWDLAVVAQELDRVVGMARCSALTPTLLRLDQVSVSPAWSHRGIGSALLATANTEAKATKEIVFDTASSLLSDGKEPSIVNVQAKIGGGSYTTIKRYLDAWNVQREISAQEGLETPSFVLERSAELGRQLWAMALRDANKQTQSVREAAESKVTAIARDLEVAHSEIRRMEELEESQALGSTA